MKRLATVPNSAAAAELLRLLEEAGIKADSLPLAGPSEIWVGGTDMVVWVLDADFQNALPIRDQYEKDVRARQSSVRCPDCGYNFRGHALTRRQPTEDIVGHCPECGKPFRLPTGESPCPHCGKMVPANFDICWNCERPLAADVSGP